MQHIEDRYEGCWSLVPVFAMKRRGTMADNLPYTLARSNYLHDPREFVRDNPHACNRRGQGWLRPCPLAQR